MEGQCEGVTGHHASQRLPRSLNTGPEARRQHAESTEPGSGVRQRVGKLTLVRHEGQMELRARTSIAFFRSEEDVTHPPSSQAAAVVSENIMQSRQVPVVTGRRSARSK